MLWLPSLPCGSEKISSSLTAENRRPGTTGSSSRNHLTLVRPSCFCKPVLVGLGSRSCLTFLLVYNLKTDFLSFYSFCRNPQLGSVQLIYFLWYKQYIIIIYVHIRTVPRHAYIYEKTYTVFSCQFICIYRQYNRVPTIDECYVDDVVCRTEANLQFLRDMKVMHFQ
jgi:hypothetical protein